MPRKNNLGRGGEVNNYFCTNNAENCACNRGEANHHRSVLRYVPMRALAHCHLMLMQIRSDIHTRNVILHPMSFIIKGIMLHHFIIFKVNVGLFSSRFLLVIISS